MSIKSEYYKNRRRIQRYVRSLEKRGIETEYRIPSIPKKITEASVRRLEKHTPSYILSKSYAIEAETAEIRQGRQIKGIEKRHKIYKPVHVETQAERERRKKAEWDEYYRRKELERLDKARNLPRQEDVIIQNVVEEFGDSADWFEDVTEETETAEEIKSETIDYSELNQGLFDLKNAQPSPNWARGYLVRKKMQVRKLLNGITQAINTQGKAVTAIKFNQNASQFNQTIDKAIHESGPIKYLDEIDLDIDNMINSLMGAMAYEDAKAFGV